MNLIIFSLTGRVRKTVKEDPMRRLERIALGFALLGAASPAYAGATVPAPVAGVGIGAVILVGIGYRALKSRIGR
jgi:hypothetical protein